MKKNTLVITTETIEARLLTINELTLGIKQGFIQVGREMAAIREELEGQGISPKGINQFLSKRTGYAKTQCHYLTAAHTAYTNLIDGGITEESLPDSEGVIRPLATAELNGQPELQTELWTEALVKAGDKPVTGAMLKRVVKAHMGEDEHVPYRKAAEKDEKVVDIDTKVEDDGIKDKRIAELEAECARKDQATKKALEGQKKLEAENVKLQKEVKEQEKKMVKAVKQVAKLEQKMATMKQEEEMVGEMLDRLESELQRAEAALQSTKGGKEAKKLQDALEAETKKVRALEREVSKMKTEVGSYKEILKNVKGMGEVKTDDSFSQKVMKEGYRVLAKKCHPDIEGGSTEAMQELNKWKGQHIK